MKSTGIVRRIDDLGRIVIPKEIRRTLRIREGDPLEMYVDGDAVIVKKYYDPKNCHICTKYASEFVTLKGAISDTRICISCATLVLKMLEGKHE